jgi:hypothetical protein
MVKVLTIASLIVAVIASAASSQAAGLRHGWRNRQTQSVNNAPQTAGTPLRSAPAYSGGTAPASVWPNYGNSVGAAYSAAAGLRQGQFFGTFGLRPADARARGAY